MIYRTLSLLTVCSLSLVVLAGCAKNPATGKMNLVLLSEDAEFESGYNVVSEAIKKYGLYKEKPGLYDYYDNLAKDLVQVTERKDKPFEFIMLDSQTFNAWATPGYINMYRGIMPFFNSEGEFLAVLAHESAHVTARHSVRGQTTSTISNVLLTAGAALLASKTQSQEVRNLALGAGVVAAKLGMAKYSRSFEDEADALALRYMERMNYDPREAVNVYHMMARYKDLDNSIYQYFHDGQNKPQSPFYDLLGSHPAPEDRVVGVERRVGKLTADFKPQGRDRYLEMLDGIAFGPNFRKYGTAGKRTIYNPEERFTWQLPEGFYIQHSNEQWRAYNNQTKTTAAIAVKQVKKSEDPEETLRVMFPKIRQLKKVNIAGLSGYTGIVDVVKKGQFGSYRKVAVQRVFGLKGAKDIAAEEGVSERKFFSMVFSTTAQQFDKLDAGFFASAKKLKLLTAKQADQIKPTYVQVYTVRKGDTIHKLSQRMAFGGLRQEWFLALNNLSSSDMLKIGQKVKLVIDPNQK